MIVPEGSGRIIAPMDHAPCSPPRIADDHRRAVGIGAVAREKTLLFHQRKVFLSFGDVRLLNAHQADPGFLIVRGDLRFRIGEVCRIPIVNSHRAVLSRIKAPVPIEIEHEAVDGEVILAQSF